MSLVLVRHRVSDFAAWRPVFEGAAELRRASGERSFHVYEELGDPDHVIGLFEWDTAENAKGFFANPELRKAMDESGVTEPPDIWYLEQVLHGAH